MSRHGIDRKRCKWPMGLKVNVLTEDGYTTGVVHKHDRTLGSAAWVVFPAVVTMVIRGKNKCQCCIPGAQPHQRYGHVIPFRNMKPLPGQLRPTKPWYKTSQSS